LPARRSSLPEVHAAGKIIPACSRCDTVKTVGAERPVPIAISPGVSMAGDVRLTDIAWRGRIPMRFAGLALIFRSTCGEEEGEGRMLPRVEKSVTVMTGMIVAGLYSILLIGVTRESYMKRDAATRDAAPRFELASARTESARTESARTENARTVPEPVSKRACLPEHPLCATLFDDATERQNCAASVEVMRRLLGETAPPLTIEALRQALRAEP
jgi:hypothetical protein